MTTPNPNKQHLQPYAAHAVPTPNQHFASTPGGNATTPRSVPSPAVTRPGTAGGLAAKHGSSSATGTPQNAGARQTPLTQGGVPMAPSLSQISNVSGSSQIGGGGGGGIGLGVTGSGIMGTSPANLLSFTSPAGLTGLDIGTPSAMLGGEGSQPMNLSFSDMGISSRRGNEEERRTKMESVLAKLQGRSRGREDVRRPSRLGRVSEEGVRRVGCWVGMDIDSEKKEKRFEGNRPVTIAGKNAVLIDFAFKNNLPTQVDVSFFSEDTAVTAHQEAAGKVLMQDLTPPAGVAAINTSLDRFAANLETLAKLDKLSVAGQLNCFEAITGVYTSLQRLYEEEKKTALALFEARKGADKEALAEKEIMCRGSGRPRMHARRKVGLSVEYWMEGRHLSRSTSIAATESAAMDIDTSYKQSNDTIDTDSKGVYTLHLTAEHNDPSVYPSLRTTSAWLSDRVHVPNAETTSPTALLSGNPSIDWQDPPPTYLGTSDDHHGSTDAMNVDGQQQQQKLPNARFVAKLDPPLAMPWAIANSILQSVGAQAGTDVDLMQTYTSILLRRAAPSQSSNSSAPQPPSALDTLGGVAAVASAEKSVLRSDRAGETRQRCELWVPKQEFGYVLRSIPFAHPRQIVQVLPVLRQWAQVGSLLQQCFLPEERAEVTNMTSIHKGDEKVNGDSTRWMGEFEDFGMATEHEERKDEKKMFSLADLITPPPSSPEEDGGKDVEMGEADNDQVAQKRGNGIGSGNGDDAVLAIDLSLSTTPSPCLDVVFPLPSLSSGLASVSVSLMGDGEVAVLGQNLVEVKDEQESNEDGGQQVTQKRARQIGRALEVTGDLGVWVEWLRREFG